MAPNLITLMGAIILGSSVPLILYYDLTFSKDLPAWVCIYVGLSVFLYQTFDAVDGKQARNTGSASPLGQLFDHGCDSLACTCLTFMGCQLPRVGNSPFGIILMIDLGV